MYKLNTISIIVVILLTLILFLTYRMKMKRLSKEIESVRFEQDKINFRLYVTEMQQKNKQEKIIS